MGLPRREDRMWVFGSYIGASVVGHFTWEVIQLPLYILWKVGTPRQLAFAVLHCTLGDAMIAGFSLVAALALIGRSGWPKTDAGRVYSASLACGVLYTVFSEWMNTRVRGAWSYSPLMPILPFVGTGLAPLLQWIAIPTLAMWVVLGRAPWISQSDDITKTGA
jgi:hypothetical protein